MVDLSLKKARRNWKNARSTSPSLPKWPASPTKSKNKTEKKAAKESPQMSQLPTMNSKQKTKVASSMQRRLSVHNPNYVPPKLDYSMPLPTASLESLQQHSNGPMARNPIREEPVAVPESQRIAKKSQYAPTPRVNSRQFQNPMSSVPAEVLNPVSLKRILSDPRFNAKSFFHDALGDASAVEIDRFTSSLNVLANEVQEEAKENINKSYKEILTVNNDLGVASAELKHLRLSIKELNVMMEQFLSMAEKKLESHNLQEHPQSQSTASSSSANVGLLPPVRANTTARRDRTSVAILEKIWDNQLLELFKNVDGSQKYITPKTGRHILIETGDWLELNIATLKPLQNVHIFVLNDAVLVAGRARDKQKELAVSQCAPLRDVSVATEGRSNDRLTFTFGNNIKCLYQSRNSKECMKLLNVFRCAKDDLRDILLAEEANTKKIKESFNVLSSNQTPGKENSKSPLKGQRLSMGGTPGRASDLMENHILENITISMHSRSRSRDVNSISQRLKSLDDVLEEIDIDLERLKFEKAVDSLLDLEAQLTEMATHVDREDLILHSFIALKCDKRREKVCQKLLQHISCTQEVPRLIPAVKNMVKLGLPEEGLDSFLQNRSSLIQGLVLQIGSVDNPTNYMTQIAIIRFQTIKKTVKNFREIFQQDADRFSSILVNWCREEVDEHFRLIDKQLLNDETLSPISIRSSRKQIDGLKSVGLDFVYKLDEFIKKHADKIR
ncbi:ZYBA0S04-08746g1_1 [Zygosaccharomyces bailii CLIB 213]|uniref:Exocyst complex component EXO84 n=1 Tax=Zygosaccharomyces bailii (strain CLIB 213 / ATCC 58445 / CBS 680 / BCRC 21525 / NBRC 1098 / NCYC 1416 / NRRL Y-2227) TaxID=1333698 RepID=A0A8J2T627_ZYGB2|nr:ZYBA0S04-08746g1_1 [Zygosaccharomyces bailii CLIB 213]